MDTLKAYLAGYVDRTVQKELANRVTYEDLNEIRDSFSSDLKKIKADLKIATAHTDEVKLTIEEER